MGWLAGIVAQQVLAEPFPRLPLYSLVPLLAFACWFGRAKFRWVLLSGLLTFCLGLLWASLAADRVVSERLDSSMNRQRCIIQGRISQVDLQTDALTRFTLSIDELSCQGVAVEQVKWAGLSWYRPTEPLNAAEVWRFSVRLKRPHGFANPGLFDYSAWLAQRHIGATGYVDAVAQPEHISTADNSLAAWRGQLVEKLDLLLENHPQTPFIAALALGDRTAISDTQWQVIRASGTSHLLAISGLHIGMVGALFWWLGGWLWRRQARWLLYIPAPLAGAMVGWVAAFSYALLSGFAVPAQRAMIMFTVVVVGTLLRREVFSRRSYLVALALVLIWEPLAVLQPGFWLSFGALLVIGWCLLGRRKQSRMLQLLHIQFALWIGLMPLVLLFFDQLSLVALPANLIAIPMITLVVLPLGLSGVALLTIAPILAKPLLTLAAKSMAITWQWLEWITAQGDTLASFQPSLLTIINPWTALLAFVGVLWLLAPRGFPARWLGVCLLLPVVVPAFGLADPSLAPAETAGRFTAQVVDVGQGLAVIVATSGHLLVYDTGARFSDRFDAGADLLVPQLRPLLRRSGSESIDRLVISHGDSDHSGGLAGVLAGLPVARIDSGTVEQLSKSMVPVPSVCSAGDRWTWDGVLFEYLHQQAVRGATDNDRSCVLRVGGRRGLLLPGDLSDSGERRLVDSLIRKDAVRADVLLVPHHGSRHSSSGELLDAVAPRLAVVSSGYANRFTHPHPLTVERYQEEGIELLNTAEVGAVTLYFDSAGLQRWQAERIVHPRYWH